MRPSAGDHFHPRGDLNNAAFDRIEKIYMELQTMEPWYDNTKNITEIAIVFPRNTGSIRGDRKLKSTVRVLSELYQQFYVVTTYSDWSKYKILVIPDDIIFDEEIAQRVKNTCQRGKLSFQAVVRD